jgi:hypothetical protein
MQGHGYGFRKTSLPCDQRRLVLGGPLGYGHGSVWSLIEDFQSDANDLAVARELKTRYAFLGGGSYLPESKYGVVAQRITELLMPETAEFEVPLFQREYAWEAAQITQLIDDVFDNSPDDSLPYFLGSIVLARKDERDRDTDRTLILDGQQQLTTLRS